MRSLLLFRGSRHDCENDTAFTFMYCTVLGSQKDRLVRRWKITDRVFPSDVFRFYPFSDHDCNQNLLSQIMRGSCHECKNDSLCHCCCFPTWIWLEKESPTGPVGPTVESHILIPVGHRFYSQNALADDVGHSASHLFLPPPFQKDLSTTTFPAPPAPPWVMADRTRLMADTNLVV